MGFEFQFYFLRYLFGGDLAYKGKSVSGLGAIQGLSGNSLGAPPVTLVIT